MHRRPERWLAVSLAAVLLHVAYQATAHASFQVTPIVGSSFWFYLLIGIDFAVRAWRHPDLDPRTRRAWGLIAAGYVLFFASASLRPTFPLGTAFRHPPTCCAWSSYR